MAHHSDTWKQFERDVAKAVGGKRVPCSGTGRGKQTFDEDVHHPALAVECKYGKQVPKTPLRWYGRIAEQTPAGKIPALALKRKGQHGGLVVLSLNDFARIFSAFMQTQTQGV